MREDRRFPRRQRLTRGSDLRTTTRYGKRFRATHLEARVAVTTRGIVRIGFIVPKHGRSAVARNRLKRILREQARLKILIALRAPAAPVGVDIVMRAHPNAYSASQQALCVDVESMLARVARFVETTAQARGGLDEPAESRDE